MYSGCFFVYIFCLFEYINEYRLRSWPNISDSYGMYNNFYLDGPSYSNNWYEFLILVGFLDWNHCIFYFFWFSIWYWVHIFSTHFCWRYWVNFKTNWRCFQILWPSQKTSTLMPFMKWNFWLGFKSSLYRQFSQYSVMSPF